ncbi:hypothetical protein OCU04_010425 [Sclerotinia nivalis]|uniref:Prefoldin subunit 1 n=1 Tax=Sclerotinia nivalis TaxID=352851 RepID=A0A9X0DFV9_9HELO|nr:hypothetical protein OCU04_010425 [Sclerotinia nivalis]
MSISNEALQKLVNEIQSQAIQAEQQISVVKSQISLKQREIRLLELTSTEVSTLPPNTNVYEGVGKMYLSLTLPFKSTTPLPFLLTTSFYLY